MRKPAKKPAASRKGKDAGAGDPVGRALLLAAVAGCLGFLGGIRYQQSRVVHPPVSPPAIKLPPVAATNATSDAVK